MIPSQCETCNEGLYDSEHNRCNNTLGDIKKVFYCKFADWGRGACDERYVTGELT